MNQKNNLTEGSIIKSLLALSVPIIFANILQTAYQLTDTFWVGRLGAGAVAAVSLSFPVLFLLMSLGSGLSMAGTILVAQYKGRKNQGMTDHVAGQTFVLSGISAIILSLLGYFLSPVLIKLMGADVSIYRDAVSYIQISFIGMIFMFAFFVFQSLMRGVGDVKTPMFVVLGTVLLNLVFDPLFIFGWGPVPAFGVAGAAVASIGTQGLASIIGLVMLFGGRYGIHLKLKSLKPDFPLVKRMFKLGFPASIEQSTRALGMTVMIFLVATFGTVTIAAYGIGGRMLSFIIIPALGLSMATSTLVGQNIGAGKIDRAERIAWISSALGFVGLTVAGIVFFLFANQLSGFFIPGETQTIASSALFIRSMALTFGFIALQQTLNGAFRGSGNTFATMVMSMISLWVLQFPLAYFLSKHTSLAEVGIWYAFPIANVIAAIITVLWFRTGSWKKIKITEEEKTQERVLEETEIEEGMPS